MDGLLVETESIHVRAWQEFLRLRGIEAPKGFCESLVGTSIRDNVITSQRVLGLEGDVKELTRERDAFYLEMLEKEDLTPLPGVPALFDLAETSRLPLAVCSSSPPDQLAVILPRVLEATGRAPRPEEFFDVMVCGQDVIHQKPAPDIYVKCAGELGVPPGECLTFEDSVAGAAASAAAGMTVIVVPNPFVDDNHRWPSPYVFGSLEEALESGGLRLEAGGVMLEAAPA